MKKLSLILIFITSLAFTQEKGPISYLKSVGKGFSIGLKGTYNIDNTGDFGGSIGFIEVFSVDNPFYPFYQLGVLLDGTKLGQTHSYFRPSLELEGGLWFKNNLLTSVKVRAGMDFLNIISNGIQLQNFYDIGISLGLGAGTKISNKWTSLTQFYITYGYSNALGVLLDKKSYLGFEITQKFIFG